MQIIKPQIFKLTVVIVLGMMCTPPTTPALASEFKSSKQAQTVSIQPYQASNTHDVIERQLRAIRARDDRQVFDLTADKTQEIYDGPQSLMREFRQKKKPLYDHVHYEILTSNTPDAKFQKVELLDKHGATSLALFKMLEESDGSMRIEKILVIKTEEDPI